jgi:hypothetical protein
MTINGKGEIKTERYPQKTRKEANDWADRTPHTTGMNYDALEG